MVSLTNQLQPDLVLLRRRREPLHATRPRPAYPRGCATEHPLDRAFYALRGTSFLSLFASYAIVVLELVVALVWCVARAVRRSRSPDRSSPGSTEPPAASASSSFPRERATPERALYCVGANTPKAKIPTHDNAPTERANPGVRPGWREFEDRVSPAVRCDRGPREPATLEAVTSSLRPGVRPPPHVLRSISPHCRRRPHGADERHAPTGEPPRGGSHRATSVHGLRYLPWQAMTRGSRTRWRRGVLCSPRVGD